MVSPTILFPACLPHNETTVAKERMRGKQINISVHPIGYNDTPNLALSDCSTRDHDTTVSTHGCHSNRYVCFDILAQTGAQLTRNTSVSNPPWLGVQLLGSRSSLYFGNRGRVGVLSKWISNAKAKDGCMIHFPRIQ